jgi:hypothetical protein
MKKDCHPERNEVKSKNRVYEFSEVNLLTKVFFNLTITYAELASLVGLR